eukprot:scaffold37630_cov20-Tisochrysis_lutea.AAC.2
MTCSLLLRADLRSASTATCSLSASTSACTAHNLTPTCRRAAYTEAGSSGREGGAREVPSVRRAWLMPARTKASRRSNSTCLSCRASARLRKAKDRAKEKNCADREEPPYINQGKGDTLAQKSHEGQGQGRINARLETRTRSSTSCCRACLAWPL